MQINKFIGSFLIAGMVSAAVGQEPSALGDRLVLLDGTAVDAAIEQIDAAGKISGKSVPEGLVLDGLRRVERFAAGDDDRPVQPAAVVDFIGGGQLQLSKFTIDDKQDCHLHSAALGEVTLPIDVFRAVRMGGGKVVTVFEDAKDEKGDEDRVFVKVGGDLHPVRGLVETIDEISVVLDVDGDMKTIARDKVYGIVFALVSRPPDHSGHCLLALADDSEIWAKVQSLDDGKLSIRVADAADASVPWSAVQSMQVRSTRMVFLSDLEPTEARHQPLVTLQRPPQMDQSVGGRPLTLAGRTFDKGIGVASRSVLVFENEGNFDLLAATIGIDAETEGRGDCVFVVEADGREIFQLRMTGKDPPKSIALDVSGKRRIALIVEPAEDLDLADHADWCDARFVRK